MKQPVALFTLNDTSQAVEFARSLTSMGWTVLATMETVPQLKAAGIPCEDIYSPDSTSPNQSNWRIWIKPPL